ncbi:MAG: hypothetical protein Q9227_000389 [Pyrenula ochraceoflavens]
MYSYNYYPYNSSANNPGNQTLLPPGQPEQNDFDREFRRDSFLYGEVPHVSQQYTSAPRSYPQPDYHSAQQTMQSHYYDASRSYAGSSTPQAGSQTANLPGIGVSDECSDFSPSNYNTANVDESENEETSLVSSNINESTLPTSFPSSAVGGSDNEQQEYLGRKGQPAVFQQQHNAKDDMIDIGAGLQNHPSPGNTPMLHSPRNGYPAQHYQSPSWDQTTVHGSTLSPSVNPGMTQGCSKRGKKLRKSPQSRRGKGKDIPRKIQRQAPKEIKNEPNEDFVLYDSSPQSSNLGASDRRQPSNDELQYLKALLRDNSKDLVCHWIQNLGISPDTDSGSQTECVHHSDTFVAFQVASAQCRINADQKRAEDVPQNDKRRFGCTCGCGKTFGIKWDWERHEQLNVIRWPCPIKGCTVVLPRRDKIQNHFDKFHPGKLQKNYDIDSQNLYAVFKRHCGLCLKIFEDPSDFINHVALHWTRKIPGPCTMRDWQWEYPSSEIEMGNADDDDGGDDGDDNDSSDRDNDQSDNNNNDEGWGNYPSYQYGGDANGAGPSNYHHNGGSGFGGSGYTPASGFGFGDGGYGQHRSATSRSAHNSARGRPSQAHFSVKHSRTSSATASSLPTAPSRCYHKMSSSPSLHEDNASMPGSRHLAQIVSSDDLGTSTRYERFLIEGVSLRSDYSNKVDDHCQTLLHSFTEPSVDQDLSQSTQPKVLRAKARRSSESYLSCSPRAGNPRSVFATESSKAVKKQHAFALASNGPPRIRSPSNLLSRLHNSQHNTVTTKASSLSSCSICPQCRHRFSMLIPDQRQMVYCLKCKEIVRPLNVSSTSSSVLCPWTITQSTGFLSHCYHQLERTIWWVILAQRVAKILRRLCQDHEQKAEILSHSHKRRQDSICNDRSASKKSRSSQVNGRSSWLASWQRKVPETSKSPYNDLIEEVHDDAHKTSNGPSISIDGLKGDITRAAPESKIAIVGMSNNMFDRASDADQFWNLITEGLETHRHGKAPSKRFDVLSADHRTRKSFEPCSLPNKILSANSDLFDKPWFDMSAHEFQQMGPMRRLALFTEYEVQEIGGFVANQESRNNDLKSLMNKASSHSSEKKADNLILPPISDKRPHWKGHERGQHMELGGWRCHFHGDNAANNFDDKFYAHFKPHFESASASMSALDGLSANSEIGSHHHQYGMLAMLAALLMDFEVDSKTVRHQLSSSWQSRSWKELQSTAEQTYSPSLAGLSDLKSRHQLSSLTPMDTSIRQLLMSMNVRSPNRLKRLVQRSLSDCLEGAVTECELVLDLPRIRSHIAAKALVNSMTGQIQVAMQLSTGADALFRFITSSLNRFPLSDRLKEIARSSDFRIAWTGQQEKTSQPILMTQQRQQVLARKFNEVDKHVSFGGPVHIHKNAVGRPLEMLTGMCGFHLYHALPISGSKGMKLVSEEPLSQKTSMVSEEPLSSPKIAARIRSGIKSVPGRLRKWRKKRSHSEIS